MRSSYFIPAALVVAILVLGVAVSARMQLTGGPPVGAMAVGFSPTGDLTTARSGHSATLLPNGMVLIAGGLFDGLPLASAELYNTATGTFTATGSLLTGRYGHSATILPNGKALIVGGLDSLGGSPATAELYDPASGTFTTTGSLTTPRYGHTATLLPNGTVLVAGGAFGITTLNSAEIYDPATGTFAAAAGNLVVPRASHTATVLSNGKVLLAGGSNCCPITFLRSAEVYDPATGQFQPTNQLMVGVGRYGHTATALANGLVLIAGGFEASGSTGASAAAQIYDPAAGVNGTFTATTGNLNAARGAHSATLLPSGRVLIAGGYNNTGGGALASAELYNPGTGTFSSTGTLNTARSGVPATLLPSGIVLFPGGSIGVALASSELFEPATGTFLETSSLGGERLEHSATLLATGDVLVAGGQSAGLGLATAEVWDSVNNLFFAAGSMPGPRTAHSATLLPNGKVLIAGGSIDGIDASPSLSSAVLYDAVTNTFSETGNMVAGRKRHTATLLANGTVLLTGGTAVSMQPLASAEIYDPSSGTFTATGNLVTGRYHHTATLLPDGTVLVVGGNNSSTQELATAERYNPATGSFSATGTLAQARTLHSATLLPTGKVLVAGGFAGTVGINPIGLSSAELYSPSTGTFSGTGSLGTARGRHSATVLPRGTVLLAGGHNPSFAYSAEIYEPATGAFSTTDTLNSPRTWHTGTLLSDGTVLLAGGFGPSSSPLVADQYDTGSNFSEGRRPSVNPPTSVGQPHAMALTGLRFRGDSDASAGTTSASATNVPMLLLQRVDNDQVIWVSPGAASTDTSFTSTALSGLALGHYRVTIFTNAIPSRQRVVLIGTFGAPTGLTATVTPIPSTSNWSAALTWTPVAGAESYEIHHAHPGLPMSLYATSSQPSFAAIPYSSVGGITSIFKVRAVGAGTYSDFSTPDIATTLSFTDAVLTGVTVKATHLAELRTAVNAVRAAAGLSAASFGAAPTVGVTLIQRQHIIDLRSALDAARAAIGVPAITYADPAITATVTPVRGAHITELRAGTQ